MSFNEWNMVTRGFLFMGCMYKKEKAYEYVSVMTVASKAEDVLFKGNCILRGKRAKWKMYIHWVPTFWGHLISKLLFVSLGQIFKLKDIPLSYIIYTTKVYVHINYISNYFPLNAIFILFIFILIIYLHLRASSITNSV